MSCFERLEVVLKPPPDPVYSPQWGLLCLFTALAWLFADGYISVMNVELNIKEMLELGKKAQAAGRGGTQEGDTISIGSR